MDPRERKSAAFNIYVQLDRDFPETTVDKTSQGEKRAETAGQCAQHGSVFPKDVASSIPQHAGENSSVLAFARNLRISPTVGPVLMNRETPSLLGVFVPPSITGPPIGRICSKIDCGVEKVTNEKHEQEERSNIGQGKVSAYLNSSRLGETSDRPSTVPQQCFDVRNISLSDDDKKQLSEDILPQIHPALSKFSVFGIVATAKHKTTSGHGLAGDLVFFLVPNHATKESLVEKIQGESMSSVSHAVITLLPISQLFYSGVGNMSTACSTETSQVHKIIPDEGHEIPPCPVCLHHIDPQRLGFPKPSTHQICSQFCPSTSKADCCTRIRFLTPWPYPAYCDACNVIENHMKLIHSMSNESVVDGHIMALSHPTRSSQDTPDLASESEVVPKGVSRNPRVATRQGLDQSIEQSFCYVCKMKETLWVCLCCGVVGCGRYSGGHAEQHYNETGHAYSLELVTQRIWDYATGEFAHRVDLLCCPSMQKRLGNASSGNSSGSGAPTSCNELGAPQKGGHALNEQLSFESLFESTLGAQCALLDASVEHMDDPSPKKTSMIGEEYEALLQSALEDQAQHYEFEITRLIADLTAKGVDEGKISEKETMEIDVLQRQISKLHIEADRLGRDLLDAQGQEAGYRATYQRLSREQAVARDLLDTIKKESKREQEEGNAAVAELEQQIVDLTANLQMRDQIARDEELSKAQIFGTTYVPSKPKRGKKSRRAHRK